MYCSKCSCEDCQIIQEKKPIGALAIVGAIFLFPFGLLFLFIRGTKTMAICKKCGNKFEV